MELESALRAVVFDKELKFVPDRPAPKRSEDECLVRVLLAGICATDLHITNGYMDFHGVLGHEMVGVVEEGDAHLIGRRVVGEINCVCGTCALCRRGLSTHCSNRTVMGILGRDGCFADYVVLPRRNLYLVPHVLNDEQAVFVEPLAAAYQVLAQCPIDERMSVAVIGPGRLGLLVAQVLATTGCKLVVVGRNPEKLERCEKKGIQGIHVDDLEARKDRDVVVDCTGSPVGLELAMSMVRPRGTIVLKSTHAGDAGPNLAPIVIDEVTLLGSRCGPFPTAIDALAREAVEVRSMISRTYPIEQALDAVAASRDSRNLKILLKINAK